MQLVDSGDLPFHSVTSGDLETPVPGKAEKPRAGNLLPPMLY